uniref:Uncharacterized protein n=1 Tax=Vespula pensylvanica TaxID=30213 RepID=A0A834UGK7_VESPE|nr:hypothetical protein H0235_001222 [Vespula pensylvanica]
MKDDKVLAKAGRVDVTPPVGSNLHLFPSRHWLAKYGIVTMLMFSKVEEGENESKGKELHRKHGESMTFQGSILARSYMYGDFQSCWKFADALHRPPSSPLYRVI